MRFELFMIVTCFIFEILDLFRKGFDTENMLIAGLISAAICITGKIWLGYEMRMNRKYKKKQDYCAH